MPPPGGEMLSPDVCEKGRARWAVLSYVYIGKQQPKSRVYVWFGRYVFETLGWVLIACIVLFLCGLGGLACMYVFCWERERDRGAPQSSQQQQLRRHSLRWCSPAEFHHQIASREREKRVHFEYFYSFTRQLGSFFIFTISALGGRWRTSCVRCGAIHVPDHILSALYTGNVCVCIHTPMRGYRLK